jgi:hypothetical protein
MTPEPVIEANVERESSSVLEATENGDAQASLPQEEFSQPEVAPVAEAEAEPAMSDPAEFDVDIPATAIEPFEPSAEAQAEAEEQSRAAIQDAFEEPEAPVQAPFETPVEFAAPPVDEFLAPPEEAVSVEPSPDDQAEAE